MNRRRFLGLSILAPLAALGTRVPEPAQASVLTQDDSAWQQVGASIKQAAETLPEGAQQALLTKPTFEQAFSGVWQDGHAAGFQDGLAAAENAGLATWTEFRETACGPDPYGALAQRAVWDFDDMMAAQAASRPGVLYERFTCANPENGRAEIAAMARMDRESKVAQSSLGGMVSYEMKTGPLMRDGA